jgi:hypothetical protein
MNNKLFAHTKLAAYFLWEYTGNDNTLKLWRCAEDIAEFLQSSGILSPDRVVSILRLGIYDLGYINFVRHIAYRIYIHTENEDSLANWFVAERLLSNAEWRQAVTDMANIF